MANRAEKRRRKRQEQRQTHTRSSSTMNRILIAVGVLAVVLVLWNVVFSTAGDGAREPVQVVYGSTQELVEIARGTEMGDPDAPVTIMDFSDYQCPACRSFALQAKPFLQDRFIDEGLANFVYYDFPLPHFPHSFLAARAARCAGDQDAYWPYHDRLFASQSEWSGQSDPFSSFVGYAADLGLNRGDFRSCLGSDEHAEVVSANIELGRRLGVSGTPGIFLGTGEGGGERVEEWLPADFGPRIQEALERLGYGDELPDEEIPDEEPEVIDPTGTGR